MLIRIGYDIRFELAHEVPFLAVLRVHPSRQPDLRSPDTIRTSPAIPVEEYQDLFGNLCGRLRAKPGELRLQTEAVIQDSGLPDPVAPARAIVWPDATSKDRPLAASRRPS